MAVAGLGRERRLGRHGGDGLRRRRGGSRPCGAWGRSRTGRGRSSIRSSRSPTTSGAASSRATCCASSDAVLLNGDTVFEPAVLRRALRSPDAPITVTIDRKPAYDADDMKVSVEGTRLRAIGKTLRPEETDGESIGLLLFRGRGGAVFADGVEAVLRRPDGLRRWYLSVIDALAPAGSVRVASIEGLSWGEIDYPGDLARAEDVVRGWGEGGRPGGDLAARRSSRPWRASDGARSHPHGSGPAAPSRRLRHARRRARLRRRRRDGAELLQRQGRARGRPALPRLARRRALAGPSLAARGPRPRRPGGDRRRNPSRRGRRVLRLPVRRPDPGAAAAAARLRGQGRLCGAHPPPCRGGAGLRAVRAAAAGGLAGAVRPRRAG